jgi:hypothetical protein
MQCWAQTHNLVHAHASTSRSLHQIQSSHPHLTHAAFQPVPHLPLPHRPLHLRHIRRHPVHTICAVSPPTDQTAEAPDDSQVTPSTPSQPAKESPLQLNDKQKYSIAAPAPNSCSSLSEVRVDHLLERFTLRFQPCSG